MRLDKKQRRFMRIPFLVAGAIGAWRLQRWWFRQLADAQAAAAAAAAAQAQAQAQSTYSGVSSYSGGAYGRTEGSTSGSNTYRGTTSGGSGPAAASAPKPNLNGAYGCGNSCTGKDDGYYHH